MVKAKFMCLSYVMYDVQTDQSKDTKIICILSDYSIEKRQYHSRGVHDTCNCMRKNVIVQFGI